ncbi:protein FAR-RED IMPAIRED RESPONSE 1-like isoform X1 [Olea europaea var. sylvestris]|uniref:protein FAR-RED IMPAIRED RESPONSE 1-like isoform X1 n=2 Tax=Olea europaea var. sylvestris TaxID=158386 RepID=UPI000C1D266E|nr:protein FAR-RED IMPAIRED RESPONSE 1-like isoform X1 [Olea europaea var. sylvestris]XP_022888419.1 protein FAR-RED IMPAIRED RESPONSE 1-like isoform X1 [Olea europaea var. sylvestris]
MMKSNLTASTLFSPKLDNPQNSIPTAKIVSSDDCGQKSSTTPAATSRPSSPPSANPSKEIIEDVHDELLVESNTENVTNDMNIVEDEMSGGDGAIVPKVGMMFMDEKEMFEFYKRYAYDVGFPVKKRNSKRGDDGTLRYVTFTCSHEGRRSSNTGRSLKPQPTIQTDCKARISASSINHGTWRINTVHLDHNHKTSPSKSRLYRCNRDLSAHVKQKIEVNDMTGTSLHKSYNSTVVEADGHENITCMKRDCRNNIEQTRRLKLGEGDIAAIQSYFSKMQARCLGFYFSMDFDDELRLKNIFWADNRCRQAYKEFGDVVTFDTTYLINKYDIPFVPFVGVNHHGQSILLGCGLVSNEDTDTFVWLFRTWLQCMNGQAPYGIITDQDSAIQNAIQIVFPNTKHRWCLWHIMKKLPEKFGYHVDKGSIFSAIHGLVYDSQMVEEYEEGWRSMINTYDLHNNDWLSGLYENRDCWVPCFLKTTFWAGMSTTQRNESMNAFFHGYVHPKTSLKQFVEQYERALRNKVEKEFQADFKSFLQMVPCATKYEMEKQFQSVYTISKFREVQDEFTGKIYCDLISVSEGCFGTTYEVREDVMHDERRKKKTFFVSFQKEKCEIICSCHLFEFRGIICRHAIAVLIRNDVTSLPERYILRRWRRDISRAHTRVAVNYDGLVSTPEQLRYDNMCEAFARVADLAADDEGRTRMIMDWIEFQSKELVMTKSSSGSNALL